MYLPTTLLTLLLTVLPTLSTPAPPTANQLPISDDRLLPPSPPTTHKFPSKHTSTILARRLLSLSPTGYLTTTYPPLANLTTDPAYRFTPPSAAGFPIALPEYIADCEHTGDPTMILLDISTAARNAYHHGSGSSKAAAANISLAVDWWAGYERAAGHAPRSPASLPRVALLGVLEELDARTVERGGVKQCFWDTHADARAWEPGSRWGAHAGRWVRLSVQGVYWVGGFGDRAWIGWLDVEEWRAVTREEIEGVRLPGEGKEEGGEEL